MSRNTAWTDEELGHLQDLSHLNAAQVARVLGRTRKQVLHMRQRIRLGWERQLEPVSDADLDFVAAYPHFTAEQIARHLGRTTASINGMRRKLRDRGYDVGADSSKKNPWHVGNRTLVARTCARCGLLLDASWFCKRGTRRIGHLSQHCRKCSAAATANGNKRHRYSQKFADRLQAITLETAVNNRKEWTTAEMAVVADPDRTTFEKAVTLGRTYYGVASRSAALDLRSRKEPVGDPTEAQWFIRLRAEMALALEVSA